MALVRWYAHLIWNDSRASGDGWQLEPRGYCSRRVRKVREALGHTADFAFLAQATEEASSTLLSASSPCPSCDLPPRRPFGLSPPFSPYSPVLSLPPSLLPCTHLDQWATPTWLPFLQRFQASATCPPTPHPRLRRLRGERECLAR